MTVQRIPTGIPIGRVGGPTGQPVYIEKNWYSYLMTALYGQIQGTDLTNVQISTALNELSDAAAPNGRIAALEALVYQLAAEVDSLKQGTIA